MGRWCGGWAARPAAAHWRSLEHGLLLPLLLVEQCRPPSPLLTLHLQQLIHPFTAALANADERDEIMTQALLRLEGRVVGVVGLAHLDGIERRWEQLQASGRALTAG